MRIAASNLLLAFAVSIDLIDLLKSEPKTLKDLFEGYNGIMPPAEEMCFKGQLRNFEKFGGNHMTPTSVNVVKRNHIIFGWKLIDYIMEPCRLFPNLPHLRNIAIVFDMNEEKWITLPHDLSQKLGVNRRLDLVIARDEVALKNSLTSNNPVYKEAHIRACKQANVRVDIVEEEQEDLLIRGRTTIEHIIMKIQEEYSQAYNRELTLYLYQHGEYNINGHRESNA